MEDRKLNWLDIIQCDPHNPGHLESQEVEKERIYRYLEYCKVRYLNPDSFNNYQSFKKQND